MNSAKVTMSRTSNGVIRISIEDDASSFQIVSVEMQLGDFAECLTGLASSQAEIVRLITERQLSVAGKQRVVERVFCEHTKISGGKEAQRDAVLRDFRERFEPQGYWLQSDGTNSQQPGGQHKYSIMRFEETGQ